MANIWCEKSTDDVSAAVRAATALMSFAEVSQLPPGSKTDPNDFALSQTDIQRLAQMLCRKTVQNARTGHWCCAGRGNHNCLIVVGKRRRLVFPGECGGINESLDRRVSGAWVILEGKESGGALTFGQLTAFWKDFYPQYFLAHVSDRRRLMPLLSAASVLVLAAFAPLFSNQVRCQTERLRRAYER
jgi:hypothetical protein